MTLEQRQYAIHRIGARRQLWLHLACYAAMATYFVILWARSSATYFWPIWPMIGWAMGLVAHTYRVLGWERPISEERIQREIDRSI